MRIHCLIAAPLVLACATAAAQNRSFDAKGLARYDASYLHCEAAFPEMKGHRDQAYLSLWRVKPGPKSAALLTEVRGSAPYKSEQRIATRRAASPGAGDPAAVQALERQCKGLWGEMQRMPKPAK
ncbi:MAG: hypothetical protein ABIQ33_09885 [Caldimonas sp.]